MDIDIDQKKEKSIFEILLYYLNILVNYKWFIIIVTVLITAATVAFLIVSAILPPDKSPLPNTYRAFIVLYIQREGGSGLEALFTSSFQDSPLSSFFSGIDIGDIAIALVHSGSFMDLLVEELEIPKKLEVEDARKIDYRKYLLSKMQVNYDRTRSILTIQSEDIDPVFTADLVNRTAKHLINWFSEEGGTKKANFKKLLEEKIVEVSEDISKLETKIQRFQKKYGVLTPEELATVHSNMMTDLNNQLLLIELEIKNHSELIKVQDSRLRRLKIERENILELIEQIENGYTATGRVLPPKNKVPDLLLEFNQLEMDLSIQTNIYETLLEQYEVLKISAGVDNVFQILEWAEVPEEKAGPSRIQYLAIAIGAGLVLSVGIALLHNLIKKMKSRSV